MSQKIGKNVIHIQCPTFLSFVVSIPKIRQILLARGTPFIYFIR